jgi:hypothetical protein
MVRLFCPNVAFRIWLADTLIRDGGPADGTETTQVEMAGDDEATPQLFATVQRSDFCGTRGLVSGGEGYGGTTVPTGWLSYPWWQALELQLRPHSSL